MKKWFKDILNATGSVSSLLPTKKGIAKAATPKR